MRKIIGRFSAAGSDGRAYSVEIVQTYVARTADGDARLFTANGEPVTREKQGVYHVTGSGIRLTSAARTAP